MFEVFEVCFRHRSHIGVFQTGVVFVDSINVSFGPEVNVGETALVSPLFAYVHIN